MSEAGRTGRMLADHHHVVHQCGREEEEGEEEGEEEAEEEESEEIKVPTFPTKNEIMNDKVTNVVEVEDDVETETEEEEENAEEEEQEEEELFEVEVNGVMYVSNDDEDGDIYSYINEEVGDIVGKFKDKNATIFEGKNKGTYDRTKCKFNF